MGGYKGRQGRKKKASTIIENERNRIINKKMPPCPVWLPLEAKRIWKKEARALYKTGLLTYVDGPAFANYCLIRAQLKKAQEELGNGPLTYEYTNKNGSTNEMPKPQIAIINKCMELLKAYSAEFGMTPASRTRIPNTNKEVPKPKNNQPHKTIPLTVDPRDVLELPN